MPEPTGNNGDGGRLSTFILIPYSATDDGTRPLPSSIPSWLCSSILVDGAPYTGTPLTLGVPVRLSVKVENLGALIALASVQLYFADPTTAFSSSSVHPIGQTPIFQVPVSTSAFPIVTESPPILWTPTPPISSHVCLFAEVVAPGADHSPGNFDVVHDRHYGQQNINILTAKNGQKKFSEFFVTNSSLEPASYAVHARPVAREALQYLGRVFKAEPFPLNPSALTLRIAVPGLPQQATQDISLELKPQERRLCQLVIEVPPDFQLHPEGPHRFLAVELQQERTGHTEGPETNSTVGTLGVVVFAETEA